ncbi:MAG: fibronectin type III domain-containing protein [Firmicutes bacterium]|nr:fibronectin type III domain-containing protein [Bacillota bacterium]
MVSSPVTRYPNRPTQQGLLTLVLMSAILLGIATLVSGCFGGLGQSISYPSSPPKGPTGGVAVRALVAKGLEQEHPIVRIAATLQRGNHRISQDLVFDPDTMTASGTLNGVLIGSWQLRIDAYSRGDKLLYSGFASILVEEGRTVSSKIVLTAAPGTLVVEMDLRKFAHHGFVKGKLIFGTDSPPNIVKEFGVPESFQTTVTIDELPSRTHDLRVELYENTYHQHNRIYEGPWQTVSITPGEVTQVSWSPAWGIVEIIGTIDVPPPSPTQVHASVEDDGILLRWAPVEPPEGDLAGYLVYVQLDAFVGYQLVAELPTTKTSYLYRPEPFPDNGRDDRVLIQFAVSSFDRGGHESLRSSPVSISWSR